MCDMYRKNSRLECTNNDWFLSLLLFEKIGHIMNKLLNILSYKNNINFIWIVMNVLKFAWTLLLYFNSSKESDSWEANKWGHLTV